MKNILKAALLFAVTVSYGQTATKNYVKETTRRTASAGQPILIGTTNTHVVTTTYYDGLGRPIQIADQNSSTDDNKNIITHIEYEKNIGQTKEYLPFIAAGTKEGPPIFLGGGPTTAHHSDFIENGIDQTLVFYNTPKYENTANPYSESRKEASPRQRLVEAGFAGAAWEINPNVSENDHNTIRSAYTLNEANEVKRYSVTTSFSDGIYKNSISENGFYPTGSLKKIIVKNENWKYINGKNNTTEEFKDTKGNVVLKRNYNNGEAHDTYYVYNRLDLLAFVIPPMANGNVLGDHLDKWCYQYHYDAKKRLVEKKLPQKEWEYIVYDKMDRVIMTGPVYNPFGDGSKGWLITKYDLFGRSIYTGYYAGGTFNSAERNSLSQNNFSIENKSASNTTIDGITTRYTNTSFPTSFKLLSINYYDNYSYPNAPTSFPTVETQTVNTALKGQLTGSWTRVLTTAASTAGNLSYILYADKYRAIRSYSQNHLGGYTQVDNLLNFTGTPAKTVTYQKQNGTAAVLTVTDVYTYDRRDRLTKQTQQVGTGTVETIVSNTYDELGVLITKNVGGTSGNLQTVGYKYNIRGWLTDINNASPNNDIGNDLFQLKINYDQEVSGWGVSTTPLYNGNISSIYSRTKINNIIRGYEYKYDQMNRLLEGNIIFYNSGGWRIGWNSDNSYNERPTYDKNGNILTMERTGEFIDGQPVKIDELTYTYNGNQLQTVTDATNNNDGFKDGNKVGYDYTYDTFGNITQDKNKGITAVSYNHLNLPYQVTFANGGNIKYIYDAAGTRLKKQVQPSGGALVTTDYVNGFQYENNSLKFFHQPEGFVEYKNNQYIYNYIYKDHLGNNRLVYADLNKDGVINPANEIIEENNYYPFGLKHKGYNELATENPSGYKYKFGGKELNNELGLDLYDFGARNYDPALGRWLNIDPLAENSRRWTPYNYAYNNPIYFVDPDGMQSASFNNGYYDIEFSKFGGAANFSGGNTKAYWDQFLDDNFESSHSDDIIGTDGNAISYTLDEKNNITWSENTPKEFQDIANELILNSPSGKSELDEILYNSMYKYIVEIKEDLIEDKGGILHGKFVPNPDSIQPGDDTVYNANIILYKGGYNKIYHDQGGKNGTIGFLGYSYEGKYLSMNKLMASTLGHEFKHRFKANSRTLTPGMEYQFYEKNPNRFQLQILNEMYNKSMLNYKR